ncbi:hypothetical protein C2W64_03074 [Brevibacillus laterosporus]|nr:hypothetical protein C2W64_03074 [Brevibacillus laterosporus]
MFLRNDEKDRGEENPRAGFPVGIKKLYTKYSICCYNSP